MLADGLDLRTGKVTVNEVLRGRVDRLVPCQLPAQPVFYRLAAGTALVVRDAGAEPDLHEPVEAGCQRRIDRVLLDDGVRERACSYLFLLFVYKAGIDRIYLDSADIIHNYVKAVFYGVLNALSDGIPVPGF